MIIFYIKRIFDFLNYKFCQPHKNGHGIHSPFLFSFLTEGLYKKIPINEMIKDIYLLRTRLLKKNEILNIEDLGAGSLYLRTKERKISDIVRFSSSEPKYGMLLYKIVNYFKSEIVIELGTCLGLGTMYLASGNESGRVFTIEGSQSLLRLAKKNFQDLNMTNIFVKHGNFDEVLPAMLKENGKFDLMFIDGNHRKKSILNYFYISLSFARDNSVMIFDDIRWSEEMFEAWSEIIQNENVRISLDLFKIGIIFFCKKLNIQHFEIYY
jgi:predicted O-methyltransferase YrrM